jgi:type VI secretion system Hcp family effector
VEGTKIGKFPATATNQLHNGKGEIQLNWYDHALELPIHKDTKQATGSTLHHNAKLRKDLDAVSPLFQKALDQPQDLTLVINLYKPDPTGTDQLYKTITLSKARVVKIQHQIHNRHTSPDIPPEEEISFVYDSIAWQVVGGAEHEASWSKKGS